MLRNVLSVCSREMFAGNIFSLGVQTQLQSHGDRFPANIFVKRFVVVNSRQVLARKIHLLMLPDIAHPQTSGLWFHLRYTNTLNS